MSDTAELIEDRLQKSVQYYFENLDLVVDKPVERPVALGSFTQQQRNEIEYLINGPVYQMILAARQTLQDAVLHAVAEEMKRMSADR